MFLHKLTDIIASANQGDIKVCRMVVKGAKLFFYLSLHSVTVTYLGVGTRMIVYLSN